MYYFPEMPLQRKLSFRTNIKKPVVLFRLELIMNSLWDRIPSLAVLVVVAGVGEDGAEYSVEY